MEEPAAHDERLGRGLDVQDAGARRHPLRRPVGDEPAAAVGVLVLEGPVDHVRDGLEAAVGVPGCALRLAGAVVDRAHLVHMHERVERREVHPVERSAYGKPLALEAPGRSGHAHHRARVGLRVGFGDPGKGEGIGGDGWHGFAPRWDETLLAGTRRPAILAARAEMLQQ